MIARKHLRRRLSQYGALWLGGFVGTLAVMAVMVFGVRTPLAAADLVLPIALALLGLAVIAGVVITVVKDIGLSTKSLITALALLLVLPLLWAPVLAVVVTAAIAGASVEYSTVYAEFRIAVSNLIYPLVAMLGEDPLISFVWQAFQVVASVVGAIASTLQVWRFVKPLLYGPDEVETA
ncbi:hypothetical protein J2X45_002724 [Caulobacter sp. BE264]|uniref:hypothetical protein n=1 Tax=Caulobacter sp. BE264 TaxID=2817724 RepID=UPI00285EA15D|nr:hypothetical protein [Caulobacter sp. BE264]MDR7231624.1 hypothetical protein [Caulobacter sp. BE264]